MGDKKGGEGEWFSDLVSSLVTCCNVPKNGLSDANGKILQSRPNDGGAQCGIGVVVTVVGDDLVVDEIAPGGPAAKSGDLMLGDVIVKVDGREVKGGQPDAELLSLILGRPGTKAEITILRGDSKRQHTFKIVRGRVSPP